MQCRRLFDAWSVFPMPRSGWQLNIFCRTVRMAIKHILTVLFLCGNWDMMRREGHEYGRGKKDMGAFYDGRHLG